MRHRTLPLFAASLLAAAAAFAQDGPIPGKEIQETWVGKELTGTAANGAKTFMKLEANGTASVTAGATTDSGTWRPWEKGYCTTWSTIRAGQERCFTVTRSGSRIQVHNPDGSLSGYFTNVK